MSNIKAFFFDLDGTLADTIGQLAQATINVAKILNLKVPDVNQVRSYVGNGAALLLARVILEKKDVSLADADPEILKKALDCFKNEYLKILDQNYVIYPNVIECLKLLKAKNFKTAVITNKPQIFAKPLLNYMNIDQYFDYILGGEVLEVKKPDPTPLLYVCDKLELNANEVIMVGDSANDIKAAINAKIKSVVFTFGYSQDIDVKTLGADYVFDNYQQLINLIKTL